MEQREATGHYGTKFSIFQCPECSGIWLDKDVVFAVSRDSALDMEGDVDFEEIAIEAREVALFCPRCSIYLKEQSGGRLPKGLHIDYCTTCHGFWFDKGELMIYKSYLEGKRQKSRERFEESEARKRKQREARRRIERESELERASLNASHSGMLAARLLISLLRFLR